MTAICAEPANFKGYEYVLSNERLGESLSGSNRPSFSFVRDRGQWSLRKSQGL